MASSGRKHITNAHPAHGPVGSVYSFAGPPSTTYVRTQFGHRALPEPIASAITQYQTKTVLVLRLHRRMLRWTAGISLAVGLALGMVLL